MMISVVINNNNDNNESNISTSNHMVSSAINDKFDEW